MFRFFRRRREEEAERRVLADFDAFLEGLSSMDSDEVAAVYACALHFRNDLLRDGVWDLYYPAVCLATTPDIIARLFGVIQGFQQDGRPHLASGVMVWFFTLRAANNLPQRMRGRQLWKEMSRGFAGVDEAARSTAMVFGARFDTSDSGRFPDGFTPEPR